MKVPLLDLKPQYQSLKKELDDAILRVAESQHFILGPEVEKMEKEFCEYLHCKHAIGVSSGTDALLLALMAIDIKPGDEVIVPTYSFFATAGVVSRLNAIPVFTDIDPVTFNINPDDFKKKITSKTKAVIPVHLYGQSAEMNAIMKIAKEKNIIVIEDAAQAIGTQYKDVRMDSFGGKCVGTIGDIGCFSFFPSKNLGGYGDGGLVTTNNDDLAYMLRIKRVHGGEQKYYHKVIGGNFRIDALQAAVLRVKLPHLDKWSEKRRANAEYYNELFIKAGLSEGPGRIKFDEKNKVLLPKAVYKNISGLKNYHIYNQYIIRVQNRDEMKKFLTENEIGNEIYYPVPFHLQECFANLNHKAGDFPEAENASNTSLAIPIYPELTKDQQEFVVQKIKEFTQSK
ncbi:MAG: DegT/DnrJ/EryC1/StrS family aminotransferase [Ignavibacteriota bacterium]|nr:MAG: DegT/DnrJ/EryC1/StrS family aminotransferase [Chlorobiota bacterium]MBE7475488.1 DegT/DnrJ/EryC1/StrS family aminotransferase [Ignavibacteriales bacterium]MBL1122455.1 DegT/DnrJ/EryC1/StrS family aminotransferase [Ignavibacteriota bacterium]MBV6422020.1 dTDP-3-amino-3,4,6-trideoxy-alpha-D-glucose transaminase [Ignavibacteriaceae bacterium]MCE7856030.1 DegT/DnrJ/EryC1/StrS family aminotransferase [Ignavibacteria bacterium CHB3]MEB2296868.1 DegT/DnrJ/EryC1/StrS family aminotransferase [I